MISLKSHDTVVLWYFAFVGISDEKKNRKVLSILQCAIPLRIISCSVISSVLFHRDWFHDNAALEFKKEKVTK